jgi:protein-disulfide isomerase
MTGSTRFGGFGARRTALALCLTLALGVGLALGCSSQSREESQPAAELNGKTITVGQLDDYIKDQLFRQATDDMDPAKLHEVRKQALEGLIDTKLVDAEAASRGESRQKLLEQETEARSKVPEAAIKAFYDQHKPQMGNVPYEALHDQIARVLERQQRRQASNDFVESLRQKASVKILLEEPRVDVAAVGPSEGPADAPVTIIEFSDFQCPYCRHAEPTVEELMKRYQGKVRLVYRHFPLETIHPLAMGAAQASVCAEDQGRFWDYHDRLFAQDAKLDPDGLAAVAKDLGLDMAKWKACLDAKTTQEKIATDVEAGRKAGVTGTPAFFINGIPLRGALPLSDFTDVVNAELAKAGVEAKPQAEPETKPKAAG